MTDIVNIYDAKTQLSRLVDRAAAWVWCLLQDFAFLQGGSVDGRLWMKWADVPADHPFLWFDTGEQLRLRLPPGLVLPSAV
jgi:hypothetical protein